MRLRLTETAASDISQIADQIAVADPDRAEIVVSQLELALQEILRAPSLCSPIRGGRAATLRKKSVRPHVVLFEVVGDEVHILRVSHQRSDWVSLV